MLAFTQIFSGALRASGDINGRNELISEGQIAQQIITARLQSAVYVYPAGTALQLTGSGVTTTNTVRSGAGQSWTVGTDPILAMVLPPEGTGTCGTAAPAVSTACFTFYAYYPYKRGSYLGLPPGDLSEKSKPAADPANNDQWLLLEYKRNIIDGVTRSTFTSVPSVSPASATRTNVVNWFNTILTSTAHPMIRGGSGILLTDYVQPSSAAPTYSMFTVDTTSSLFNVTMNFRMLQMQGAKALRAPAATDSTPLSTRVYPRNWY